MKKNAIFIAVLAFVLFACNNNGKHDASGSFEAVETIISAEGTGVLKQFDIEEGQELKENQVIGYIDSTILYLQKEQLKAQSRAVGSRKPDANTQLAIYEENLRYAKSEQQRLKQLVQANAATQKQLDDANAQVKLIEKQIAAQKSQLSTAISTIEHEMTPISLQIKQLEEQLSKYKLINPVEGTVLNKYAEVNELVTVGKPLYKIADLSKMILRAYLSNDLLSKIKLGQKVKVRVDFGENEFKEYEGHVEWISDKAEFTPKTIQNKNERDNLVYATKISVKNDGYIRIGMYGEIIL
ncbi:MAG: HlyD family efflux transporter periplasmic adaptor subunit [Bacteroidales bacterium]|nr:HlyD family efflux transporter periplasmic adaptor subunit [Bacteroidales bacterium]